MSESVMMVLIFAVPILAIVGGIAMGIVRMIGEQRLAELARRERIAAIERGIDLDKIPPPADPTGAESYAGSGNGRLRRAHGLLIAGMILVAVGISISALLKTVEPLEGHWVLGTLPFLIGCALIAASRVVWPKGRS